jgi:hypothetical protein
MIVVAVLLFILYGALMFLLGVMRGRLDSLIERLERM